MKKIIGLSIAVLFLFSCKEAGTIENVDEKNDSISVIRYYYSEGNSIYIATIKGQKTTSTEWTEGSGKNQHTYHCTCINENEK